MKLIAVALGEVETHERQVDDLKNTVAYLVGRLLTGKD
jgi:hypothetical protein